MRILCLLIGFVASFTTYQRSLILDGLKRHNAPAFVAVLDAPQPSGSIAYTTGSRDTIYLDGVKLECCHRTFQNVLHHESAHARGREHNQIRGDIMNYSVLVSQAGDVIDDLWVWPPSVLAG